MLTELATRRVGFGKNNKGFPLWAVAVLIIFAFAIIGSPSYSMIVQYDQYRALKAQLEQEKTINADLTQELAQWNNNDYIITQARRRLGYIRPGEVQYLVLDPGPSYQTARKAAEKKTQGPSQPWFMQVATSTQDADRARQIDKALPPTAKLDPNDKRNRN